MPLAVHVATEGEAHPGCGRGRLRPCRSDARDENDEQRRCRTTGQRRMKSRRTYQNSVITEAKSWTAAPTYASSG